MKKNFFLILSLFLISKAFLFSQNFYDFNSKDHPEWYFSFTPSLSQKYGIINEYVFLKNPVYDSDKLSQLEWEIKPEWNAALELEGGFYGFCLSGYIKGGSKNSKTGLMKDSDWLNLQVTAIDASNYLYKTNYSESTNYLNYDFDSGAKLGYSLNLFNFIFIKPFVEGNYSNIEFTAKYGTISYGNEFQIEGYTLYYKYDDENNSTSGKIPEEAVTYNRKTFNFFAGVDLDLVTPFGLSASLGYKIAPYSYLYQIDNHHMSYTDYLDIAEGNFKAQKFNCALNYSINEHHNIGINYSLFKMDTLKGSNYSKKTTQKKYTLSDDVLGGSDEEYWELSLSYTFSF